jgi:membrane associated rhomboid family serine protease
MSYNSSGYRGGGNPFGFTITPWVKRLLIANVAAFVVITLARLTGVSLLNYLAFARDTAIFMPWTIVTYMFAHEQIFHLLFNMLAVFFFGPPLEDRWGAREFLKFYLLAGVGGALLSLALPWPIIGASAAVYGIMVAFAMYWPDNPIYFFGIFPIKAKWLVMGLIGLSVFFALTGGQAGVAHLAHLGGAAVAFAYLRSPWAPSAWGAVPARKKRSSFADWGFPRRGRKQKTPPAQPVRSGKLPASMRSESAPKPERNLEIDRILDKISEQGIASLTDEELKQLREASRQR